MSASTTNRAPLVSVIIIFLNGEQFIQETIESVFAQTFDRWELLLVDDGSTDGSMAIALHFAEKYPDRVRYLEHSGHQNRGMSASRNLGLRHATGKYIAYLDADDIWVPQTLEEQVTILEAQPEAAMVYGPMLRWYSWTGKSEDHGRDFIQPLDVPGDTLIEPPTLVPVFLRNEDATPSGPLMRRQVLDQLGGYEEQFGGMYEDQVLRAKICLSFPVFASSRVWYKYRQHAQGACAVSVRTGSHGSDRLRFLTWLSHYLAGQRSYDPTIRRVLRKEIWKARYIILYRAVRKDRAAPSMGSVITTT